MASDPGDEATLRSDGCAGQEEDAAADALLVLDRRDCITGWDRGASEVAGRSPAGHSANELLPDVFTPSTLTAIRQAKESGGGSLRAADLTLTVYDLGEETAIRAAQREPHTHDVIAEGALVHDGTRILSADPAVASILGCSREALVSLTAAELLDPDLTDRMVSNWESGSTEFFSARARRRNGETFQAGFAGRSFRLHGRFARFLIIREYGSADAPAPKPRTAVHASLQGFAKHSPDAICVAGRDGTIHYLNPAAREITGDRKTVADYFSAGNAPDLNAVLGACAGEQKQWLSSARLRSKDRDAAIHTQTSAFLLQDADEPLLAFTSRRLSEQEMLVHSVMEEGPGVLFATDENGYATYVNGEFERITGIPSRSLMGEGWFSSIHPEDRDEFRNAWTKCTQSQAPAEMEYRLRCADGSYRWYSHRCIPVREPSGRILRWLGVGIDIHRQKDFVNSLRHHAEELEHFAYACSHDLQEPLRTVMSCAQMLERKWHDHLDDEAREILGYIISAAGRMRTLLRDLLSYSRLVNDEPSRFQFTDSDAAIKMAMANLAAAIEDSGAEIVHEKLPPVLANGNQLIQLFQNLLSNAINYRASRTLRIHVSFQRAGDDIVFSVKDNGIGIRTEHQQKIFGLFKRLHGRERSGTGVGLTIARKIVERHNGRIWVESEFGSGSTFYFTLRSADAF